MLLNSSPKGIQERKVRPYDSREEDEVVARSCDTSKVCLKGVLTAYPERGYYVFYSKMFRF